MSFIKPLSRISIGVRLVVDHESEDAAPRFNYGKPTGRKRIVSVAGLQAKASSAKPSFRKNLHFTIETEEPELAEAVSDIGAVSSCSRTDYLMIVLVAG